MSMLKQLPSCSTTCSSLLSYKSVGVGSLPMSFILDELSEAAGALFGPEELMMLLCTEPEMLHRFMAFTRDAVLANLKQGEAAGDYSTADSRYYVDIPAICDALPEPAPNSHGIALPRFDEEAHGRRGR